MKSSTVKHIRPFPYPGLLETRSKTAALQESRNKIFVATLGSLLSCPMPARSRLLTLVSRFLSLSLFTIYSLLLFTANKQIATSCQLSTSLQTSVRSSQRRFTIYFSLFLALGSFYLLLFTIYSLLLLTANCHCYCSLFPYPLKTARCQRTDCHVARAFHITSKFRSLLAKTMYFFLSSLFSLLYFSWLLLLVS